MAADASPTKSTASALRTAAIQEALGNDVRMVRAPWLFVRRRMKQAQVREKSSHVFPTAAIARRLPACGPGATVYFETAQSLIQHGFCRILFQQETKAIAVNLNDAVETMTGAVPSQVAPTAQAFDRHSGVNEDFLLCLFPSLVDL